MPGQLSYIAEKLKDAGLRPTRQRIQLGKLLWKGCDRHITAETLHRESREADIKVSLATIYNTLHQFTEVGLLREIVVDGGRSYFDTNISHHHHFLNEANGELWDIPAEALTLAHLPSIPEGCAVKSVDVIIRLTPGA
jgi:Fur family iron response transcriptional regulator